MALRDDVREPGASRAWEARIANLQTDLIKSEDDGTDLLPAVAPAKQRSVNGPAPGRREVLGSQSRRVGSTWSVRMGDKPTNVEMPFDCRATKLVARWFLLVLLTKLGNAMQASTPGRLTNDATAKLAKLFTGVRKRGTVIEAWAEHGASETEGGGVSIQKTDQSEDNMTKWIIAIALLATVSGCAPELGGANERGGFVNRATGPNDSDAFNLANYHCKQYGRVARITKMDVPSNIMTFDCVQP